MPIRCPAGSASTSPRYGHCSSSPSSSGSPTRSPSPAIAQIPGLQRPGRRLAASPSDGRASARAHRTGVHRRQGQPAAAVLPVAGPRRPATATTRPRPRRPTSARRTSWTRWTTRPTKDDTGKPSLLTQVCSRSLAIGKLEGVDGSRPYCTARGVGAVLAVFHAGPGYAGPVTRVVSVNEDCPATPFLATLPGRGGRVRTVRRGPQPAADRADPRGRAGEPGRARRRGHRQRQRARPGHQPGLRATCRRRGWRRSATSPSTRSQLDPRPHRAAARSGFLGEPGVNVLQLNMDLDRQRPSPDPGLTCRRRAGGAEATSTRPGRGKLRIYLGAAPGVGKTYAMLNEAHRRRERGTDVVVGFVETHGRPQTAALLDGLEVLPRRP